MFWVTGQLAYVLSSYTVSVLSTSFPYVLT